MKSITNLFRQNLFLLLLILLVIPTFVRMLPYGIYSMQDFHLFRLVEFDKCVRAMQIPCRWAPDAGLGYGEPLFNYYGQGAYIFGEVLRLLGSSFIGAIKASFALSIVGSAVAMYFLAKNLWKNEYSAVIASIIYVYAPYRAVDVWVRGALPEAMAFILFPLIILAVEKKKLVYFSLLVFLLIITHNISFVMFAPLLLVWLVFRKWWIGFFGLLLSGILSSFYILPVIFESKYVDLVSTTVGYFDFRAHFLTLKQIFLSTNWGYGGSTWGDGDNVNLSVGIVQWIVVVISLAMVAFSRKLSANIHFFALLFIGVFYLFLTHNKSTPIWEALSFLKYIQFPWRFLGLAVFCFAVASGAIGTFIKDRKLLLGVVVGVAILFTQSYFRGDIWYAVSDTYFTTGAEWDNQRTASIGDYWPLFGHEIPYGNPGNGDYINYFPGWKSETPEKGGLIPSVGSEFKDTPIRMLGNTLSLVSLLGVGIYSIVSKKWTEKV